MIILEFSQENKILESYTLSRARNLQRHLMTSITKAELNEIIIDLIGENKLSEYYDL